MKERGAGPGVFISVCVGRGRKWEAPQWPWALGGRGRERGAVSGKETRPEPHDAPPRCKRLRDFLIRTKTSEQWPGLPT